MEFLLENEVTVLRGSTMYLRYWKEQRDLGNNVRHWKDLPPKKQKQWCKKALEEQFDVKT